MRELGLGGIMTKPVCAGQVQNTGTFEIIGCGEAARTTLVLPYCIVPHEAPQTYSVPLTYTEFTSDMLTKV